MAAPPRVLTLRYACRQRAPARFLAAESAFYDKMTPFRQRDVHCFAFLRRRDEAAIALIAHFYDFSLSAVGATLALSLTARIERRFRA